MRHVIALTAVLCVVVAAGCGGSSSGPNAGDTGESSPRREVAGEATWRRSAEQFAHEVETGLQSLATTARTDAYAAVSNLGPLAYCQQNLDSLGAPPPVYQLAYGSFQAACDELSSAARMWQGEVSRGQKDFQGAVYAIRRGSRLLRRGEQRLRTYATENPRLEGEEAARVQDWARQIDRYWTADVNRAFSEVDEKLRNGVADPIQALWDEHSGGAASTMTSCSETLSRSVKVPPNAVARDVLSGLQEGCSALETATLSFSQPDYEEAKRQVRAAIAGLEELAP